MLKRWPLASRWVERAGWRHMLLLAVSVCPSMASAASFGGTSNSVGLLPLLVALAIAKIWASGAGTGWVAVAAVLGALAATACFRPKSRVSALRTLPPAKPAATASDKAVNLPALPNDLSRDDLLASVRQHFVRLQAAWDAEDLSELQALTTPDMLHELRAELPQRTPGVNRTDVLTLHAELLAFEEWASADFASVEFSGMIRERADEGAAPFREVWMLTRSKGDNHAWRLARQQALL